MLSFIDFLESARSEHLVKKYPTVGISVINDMELADPGKGKTLEWIVKQLYDEKIRWPEDKKRVVDALTSFYKIKISPVRLKQYKANPDVMSYTIHDLEHLADQIEGKTARPESLNELPPDCNKWYDDGEIAVVYPKTIEAIQTLSRGTKWCTSEAENAEQYFEEDILLVWYKNGKKFAQSSSDQFNDLRDRPIKMNAKMAKLFYGFYHLVPNIDMLNKRSPDLESELLHSEWDLDKAVTYTKEVIQKRWPELEKAILSKMKRDNNYAYLASKYAKKVLQNRWLEAEPLILQNPKEAGHYARDVIKGIWPSAEIQRAKDANYNQLFKYGFDNPY